jgi:hypothetical protein
MPEDMAELQRWRLHNWRQTPETRVRDADDAIDVIERQGIATLYPVSPEIPSLFAAYMGDAEAKIDPKWDSPAGHVYTWRWVLGRRDVALYAVLVRGRPTWISWGMTPAALRLWSDQRTPDELSDAGLISAEAYRIARALDGAGGTLLTGDLRREAGFPTGKAQRAAFLSAIAELDARLLLAKNFVGESDEMQHSLLSARYPEQAAAASRLTREEALDRWLRVYLSQAAYAVPSVLARHLRLTEAELRAGFEGLAEAGRARRATLAQQKGSCYVWAGTPA